MQKNQTFPLSELTLWTENPRDSRRLRKDFTNQDILHFAIKHWELDKLIKEMGPHYDQAEQPTVIQENGENIVYDGNRRIAIAIFKHRINTEGIDIPSPIQNFLPGIDIPLDIPCNLCSRNIGLINVKRKHTDGKGSWCQIERDLFDYKFMYQKKSSLVLLNEVTGFIDKHPKISQEYLRNEVLKDLEEIQIFFDNGFINSPYKNEELREILETTCQIVLTKKISQREKRREIVSILRNELPEILSKSKGKPNPYTGADRSKNNDPSESANNNPKPATPRKNPRKREKKVLFSGKTLSFNTTKYPLANNCYRDICDLWEYQNKARSEADFTIFVRFGLRLLLETLGKEEYGPDEKNPLDKIVKDHFESVKKKFDKDQNTSGSTYKLSTLKDFLSSIQHGAHDFEVAKDELQTMTLSTYVGEIVLAVHESHFDNPPS